MGGLPVRFLITGYALLLSMQVASATTVNDWLIVPGVRAGPITAATTRADLDRVFGAKNVTDMDVTVSDEGSTPGTVVYLSNLARCLTILWANDKPGSPVGSLVFCLGQAADAPVRKGCEWHTREGVRFGTTLKQLEKLNGRPFQLLGFDWDYGGTVMSWERGALAKAFDRPCGRCNIRLNPAEPSKNAARLASADSVLGDTPFLSDNEAMQKLNPQLDWMSMVFEGCRSRR